MNNETQFRIALGVVLLAFLVVRVYYQVQARRAKSVTEFEGPVNIALRIFAGLAGFALLILYLVNPGWPRWSFVTLPAPVRWIGVPIGILAVALLFWVHRELGENFRGTLHLRGQHTLVTSGPYQWVRHPMYTAFFAVALGFFLLSASWLIGGVFVCGLTGVMATRVAKEEDVMRARFGPEYEAWAARTGRFVPKF